MKRLVFILMCFSFLIVSLTTVRANIINETTIEEISFDCNQNQVIDIIVNQDISLEFAGFDTWHSALTNCVVYIVLKESETCFNGLHGRNVDYDINSIYSTISLKKTNRFDFSYNQFST